jgi:hypothetical protein
MADLTKEQLTALNNANFINNNSGFITPQKLREFNQDMIDSMVTDIDSILTGSITVDGTVTATEFVGDGSGITGVVAAVPQGTVSGSSQLTSSYDERYVISGSILPVPEGTLSGSSQVDYPLISNIPSGIVSSSEQLPSGLVSGSSQVSYTGLSNIPSGIISSSEQLPSGLVSGSSQVIDILVPLNSYTSSNDTKWSNLGTQSGSFVTVDETGSFARTDVNNNFSGNQTFNDITVNGTGSFAHINYVTGSATIIGDAFVVLNTDTPTLRYAGLKVIDSGSGGSASLQWDGDTDRWLIVDEQENSAYLLSGPTGSIGGETLLTDNKLPKSAVGNQLVDSNISDNGINVSISTDVNVIGAVTASRLRVENNTHLDGTLRVTNDTTIDGDVRIQSATPNLKLRDTSGGGFSSGYDLRVDTGSFQIFDDTHDRNVLGDVFDTGTSKHITSLTSEIIIISGSDSVTIQGQLTASLQEGYAWVGNSSGVIQQVSTASWDVQAYVTSSSQRIDLIEDFTASQELLNTTFATTGSNTFTGDQLIQGTNVAPSSTFQANDGNGTPRLQVNNATLKGFTGIDVVVNGNTILDGTVAIDDDTTINGNFTATGTNIILSGSTVVATQTPLLTVTNSANSIRPSMNTQYGGAVGIFDTVLGNELNIVLKSEEWGYPNNWTGPSISGNNPSDEYPAFIGFQQKTNWTDGTVTILNPLDVSGSLRVTSHLTASLQEGYVWVGNENGRTVTAATSSFGGGGGGPATVTNLSIVSNTASMDLSLGTKFYIDLPVGSTELLVTNRVDGESFSLLVSQSSAGTGSITFGDDTIKFAGGIPYQATNNPSAEDVVSFEIYNKEDGAGNKYVYVASVKNLS